MNFIPVSPRKAPGPVFPFLPVVKGQRLTPSLCIHALTGLWGLFFPFYSRPYSVPLSLGVETQFCSGCVCAHARVVMSGK